MRWSPACPASGLAGRALVPFSTAWWPSEALEMTSPAPWLLVSAAPGDFTFTDPDGAGGRGLAARAVPRGACPFQALAPTSGRAGPGMVHAIRAPPAPNTLTALACRGEWDPREETVPRAGGRSILVCNRMYILSLIVSLPAGDATGRRQTSWPLVGGRLHFGSVSQGERSVLSCQPPAWRQMRKIAEPVGAGGGLC